MTSPLRRKRQITALNTRKGKAENNPSLDRAVGWAYLRWSFLTAIDLAKAAALPITLGLALAGTASSQEAQLPGYFGGVQDAQPISTADDSQGGTEEAAVLRWKNKRAAAGSGSLTLKPATFTGGASTKIKQSGGWAKSKIGETRNPLLSSDGTVRLVAHDPHQDPFGDRIAQAGRAPSLAPPAGAAADEHSAEEPPAVIRPMRETVPPAEAEASPPATAEPMTPADPTAPESTPPEAVPMEESLPSPPSRTTPYEEGTGKKEVPCDRVYNNRNCCEGDETCKTFLDMLRGDKITRISLDIAPRYKTDAATAEEDRAEREDKLRLAGSRAWHDYNGRLLATGHLSNLIHGMVQITDDAGSEVARIQLIDLGTDELCFVSGFWNLPDECPIVDRRGLSRNWVPATFTWHASALCHKPLYFEEVQLERYGHSAGPFKQPIISGAHFFASIATLPYQMGMSPPMECEYALGYYRPGSCAPWHIPPVPLSVRGALAEAGAWVGGIYIIP